MSYDKPRIKLEMSMMDMIVSLSEGNPGAVSALVQLIKTAPIADPDSALGALGPLCSLDTLDCYGSNIWRLFKDVCGQDVHKMLGVLRSCQLGYVSGETIMWAIEGDRGALNIPALLAQVKERLPAFQIEKPAPAADETAAA